MKSPSVRASALAPYALILLQNVIYGFGDPISKVAYDIVPVFSLLAARYLMAFTFLLLLFGKRTVQELKTAPRRQLILPCLCISSNLIGNVALVLTSATSVAFLRSLSTVIVPLLAAIVYRQNLPKKLLLVYVLVVLGSYLLCGMGGLSGFGWGEVLSLLCAVLIAGSLLFGQRSLDCVSATTLTTLQSAAATVLALACSFLFEGRHPRVERLASRVEHHRVSRYPLHVARLFFAEQGHVRDLRALGRAAPVPLPSDDGALFLSAPWRKAQRGGHPRFCAPAHRAGRGHAAAQRNAGRTHKKKLSGVPLSFS